MRRARDIDALPTNSNANPPTQEDSTFPSYWPSEYELNSGDEDSLTGMKSKISRWVNVLAMHPICSFRTPLRANTNCKLVNIFLYLVNVPERWHSYPIQLSAVKMQHWYWVKFVEVQHSNHIWSNCWVPRMLKVKHHSCCPYHHVPTKPAKIYWMLFNKWPMVMQVFVMRWFSHPVHHQINPRYMFYVATIHVHSHGPELITSIKTFSNAKPVA